MPTINFANMNPFAKFFQKMRGRGMDEASEKVQSAQGVSQEDTTIMSIGNSNTYGGAYAASSITVTGIQFEQIFSNKRTRVAKYREMANYPVISEQIDAACDDAVIEDDKGQIVNLDIRHKADMPENIEIKVRKHWDTLLFDVLNFNETAWDTVRRFLIDSELYAEKVLSKDGTRLIGLKLLPSYTMTSVYEGSDIKGFMQIPEKGTTKAKQIDFDKDQIVYINYGMYGENIFDCRGYLEAAIKSYNQLKSLEDSLVTYRLSRSPERRIWNIATGRMPKTKAEEYIKNLIQRYRKKMIYDPATGEINNAQNTHSLLEDYWFAKNSDGEGTTVEVFKGDTNFISELDDIMYLLRNLYKALKTPRSRWEDNTTVYSTGKSNEITREEIRFSRFVERFMRRFKYFLMDPYITMLKLDKSIPDQFCNQDIYNITFTKSNLFKEYKELELLDSRLNILNAASQFIWDAEETPGGMFSKDFVMKKYFRMTDDEYNENNKLLKEAVEKAEERAEEKALTEMPPEGEEGTEGTPEEGEGGTPGNIEGEVPPTATEESSEKGEPAEGYIGMEESLGYKKFKPVLRKTDRTKPSILNEWLNHMDRIEKGVAKDLRTNK